MITTPKDVQIASSLVDLLNTTPFSKEVHSRFTYDRYMESEYVDKPEILVSVESYKRVRLGRNQWQRSTALAVFLLTPQQVNQTAVVDAESEISDLLGFWDEVLNFIQDAKPAGREASSIEAFGGRRFDEEALHEDRQFRAGVFVFYNLI